MNLTRKQKRYLKKYLKKKSLEKIAKNLGVNQEELERYLEKKLPKAKLAKIKKDSSKTSTDSLKEKVCQFSFRTFFKKNWPLFLLLAVLVFAVYTNSLDNEFLSDDIDGILNNQNLESYSYIFSSPFALVRFFQPILYITINKLFGKIPTFYRLPNIFFHLGTVWLVFILVSLLFDKIIGLFSALILAAHPLMIESVTWISGGGHVMYAFFIILSLLFWVLTFKKAKYLYLSMLAFFFAVTISEKALGFPLSLIIFAWAYQIIPKNWKKLFFIAIPFVIIGLAFLSKVPARIQWLRTDYYQTGSPPNFFIQIPVAISSYLKLIFWPKNLSLYHSEMFFTQASLIFRTTINFIFLGFLIFLFFKNRRLGFWAAFFVTSLLPTVIMANFGIAWIIAERYAYLGAIGIFVFLAWGIKKIGEVAKTKKLSYILIAILVLTLAARTIVRNNDWQNQDTLWLATAKTSPSSAQNHNNLGDLYARQGNLEKAVEEFKKAIELKPNYGDAYHNLANTYQQMKKNDLAIKNYQKALSFNSNLWQSHQNLASIYFEQEKFELAKQELEKATGINPQNSNLYTNLGIVYLKLNEKQKAQEAFQKALQLDPQNQRARQLFQP